MLAFDLHLDLAMNALWYDRDLKLPLEEARAAEQGMAGVARGGGVGPPAKASGKGTVTLPEMRRGHVGLCVATVLARVRRGEGGHGTGYRTHEITYGVTQGMLAYYRELELQGEMRMVRTGAEMRRASDEWEAALAGESAGKTPVCFVLGTEGADCVVEPAQLERWWDDGLRAVSLVHYGVSKYAHGTGADGPLTEDGRELLRVMDELGAILDITHQSDTSFWESLERFRGPVFASHQNCRAIVAGGRQFSDEQLKALIERDAIVGPALDNWMLYPGYVRNETPRELIHLSDYVEHVDRICQLAGNARHVAIGSDLDGGYGYEQTPEDLLSIADLQKVPALLRAKGYSDGDVRAFMSANAVRFFEAALPGA
ncbi:MAG TPA: membrane dipeptidase [Chloroflexota bacterium]|nr:membrane dipeptidase [Chloroflexota bacterium]